MTLPTVPTIPQILAEISQSLPYTFPDNRTRWLADVSSTSPITFPTSFANKQSVKVVASLADAGGSSPHTFSGLNFGLDFSDRVLIACTCLRGANNSAMNISTITIGGVSATGLDHGEFITGVGAIGAGVWSSAVPTGTSGNVVVSWSGQSANASGLILLSVSGISQTPFFQGGQTGSGSGGTSSSASFNIPSNGVMVVASAHTNTNATSFSGLTTRTSLTVGSSLLAVGFDNRLSAVSGSTISASWSGSAARGYAGQSYQQP